MSTPSFPTPSTGDGHIKSQEKLRLRWSTLPARVTEVATGLRRSLSFSDAAGGFRTGFNKASSPLQTTSLAPIHEETDLSNLPSAVDEIHQNQPPVVDGLNPEDTLCGDDMGAFAAIEVAETSCQERSHLKQRIEALDREIALMRTQEARRFESVEEQKEELQQRLLCCQERNRTLEHQVQEEKDRNVALGKEVSKGLEEVNELRRRNDHLSSRVHIAEGKMVEVTKLHEDNAQDILRLVEETIKKDRATAQLLTTENGLLCEEVARLQDIASVSTTQEAKNTERIDVLMKQLGKALKEKRELEKVQVGRTEADWDLINLRLARAERQVRCLDSLARFQVDCRLGAPGGSPLSTLSTNSRPRADTDIISSVKKLNATAQQMAILLTTMLESYEGAHPTRSVLTRAKSILGRSVTSLLQSRTLDAMIVLLQAFLLHWCVDIINAHYPIQKSFVDVLNRVGDYSTRGSVTRQRVCGRQTKIIPTSSATTLYHQSWHKEIIDELQIILGIGGMRMNPEWDSVPVFQHLVEQAYLLRRGLAEKAHLGGLELKVIAPDAVLQPKFMEISNRRPALETLSFESGHVIAMSGIGLQREIVGVERGVTVEVVLKPQVVVPE